MNSQARCACNDVALITAIGAAPLPALQTLGLGALPDVALTPLLDLDAPALRALHLHGGRLDAAFVDALSASSQTARLEVLSLRRFTLELEPEAFGAIAPRLAHLGTLELPEDCFSQALIDAVPHADCSY